MPETSFNKVNFQRVLEHIKAALELWNQDDYGVVHDCNTPHCFIGWAAAFAYQENDISPHTAPWRIGAEWLGISFSEEDWLCCTRNTLPYFELFFELGRKPSDFEVLAAGLEPVHKYRGI